MRKIHFFGIVLVLFLLVPASITRAQVAKTTTGTVRYESGISATTFTTPNGQVRMELPQSLSGSVIQGTVTATPEGKNQKEKNRNLKELLKITVSIGDQTIPLSEIPFLFDWKPNPASSSQRTPVCIFNAAKEKLGELTLPPVIITPQIVNPASEPTLSVPSTVIVKGDLLNVYTDHTFLPGEKFVVTDAGGQIFTLKPKCLSAQQAVLQLPENIVPGELTVTEEVWNQPMTKYNVVKAKTEIIDIDISSPKTNLRPGEISEVLVMVFAGKPKEEISNDSRADRLLSIDLQNLNPNTVTMQGGNRQRLRASSFTVSTNEAALICWQARRSITGSTPGVFSISATLHQDYGTCNDPFRPQLNVLRTPDAFNTWVTALKQDLDFFSSLHRTGETGQAIKKNIQRAIHNMPICSAGNYDMLEENLNFAFSLLQPLNVPVGAAISWLSSFEAFKTAITADLSTGPAVIPAPSVHTILNGLTFVQRLAYRVNDPELIKDCESARLLTNQCQEAAPSEEMRLQLIQSLQSLTKKAEEKLDNRPVNEIWNLKTLMYDSYCLNKKTRDGIDPVQSMVGYLDPENRTLTISPEIEDEVLVSLNGVSLGGDRYQVAAISSTGMHVSYNISLMNLLAPVRYEGDWWAEYLISGRKEKDTIFGKVISTHRDTAGTWYIFYKDAKCDKNTFGEKKEYSCVPYKDWMVKDGKIADVSTAYFEKSVSLPNGTCRKGTDFCIEVYVVTFIKHIYLDANCTRLKETINIHNFSCL